MWQPIETAPKDEETVLLFSPIAARKPFITVGWFDVDKYRWFMLDACAHSHGFIAQQPTHWMPLPAPPSIGE